MLTIGTLVRKFPQVLAIAERFPEVTCSVGTHPHSAGEERDVTVEELVRVARRIRAWWLSARRASIISIKRAAARISRPASARHIAAARRNRPAADYSRARRGRGRCGILARRWQGALQGPAALLHGRPGAGRNGHRAWPLCVLFGDFDVPEIGALRELAAVLPLERLLVETDAPFLAPHPNRGKRNEPAFVRHTAKVLAEVKGVSEAEAGRGHHRKLLHAVFEGERAAGAAANAGSAA